MQDKANTATNPTATINQIKEARISELYINNICFNTVNEEVIIDMIRNQSIINFSTQVLRTQSSNYPASNIGDGGSYIQTIMSFANIKSMFVTFAMPQYPTWFFPVLFKNIDLIIDRRHVIPAAYPALTQDVCVKVYYLNKFMQAWKFATDDSFMRGYYSSKIEARTNIQVQLDVTPVIDICADDSIRPPDVEQNDFKYFISTRCYPNIKNIQLTPPTHYLCDGIVRIMFDDNLDPQVLMSKVIREIGGSAIRSV
ncbi:MAG: hypothetical protein EZS28_020198 [Streblomastix strix]|uniref:Uncharacterized protein n=1 Tax=Streblomastix strix TaxID=222440 RepID=A0A5J4VNP5_9EUKA|nr:MAG: hypothetical protein EZS28_020198 [Streblomastix strix]